jgi:hypothetical protein
MSQISIDRLHATAKKHKKNGDIDAARVIYSQILENYPQNRRARNVRTASQIQVRKKTYQNSSRDCEAYASRLKPLLDGLGSQAPRLGS